MTAMPARNFQDVLRALCSRAAAPHALRLRLEEVAIRARSNSQTVIDDLRGYFAPFLDAAPESAPADMDFLFLEGPVAEPPVPLVTRPHLPGKRPDKERQADLPGENGGPGGRIARKQATGMLFAYGAGPGPDVALGPCSANRNQLVNFICERYLERRVAAGWGLGHAAGVIDPASGRALALCGFCGMGKSTLALHLVARGCDFLSNDRVLVEPARRPGAPATLHGIPKQPRLNPGTALGNAELAPLLASALPDALRRACQGLPSAELFGVEAKYDAVIDECFPPRPGAATRFRLRAPLAGIVVLNWRHGGGPLVARRVDLSARLDLVEALRKPHGVFYLPHALTRAVREPREYLAALSGAPALELSGGSDFSSAASACLDFLRQTQKDGPK